MSISIAATDDATAASVRLSGTTIYVIATDDVGTVQALATARTEIGHCGLVRLLVPVVSAPDERLDCVQARVRSARRHFVELVDGLHLGAEVCCCVCREPRHVPGSLLLRDARILVGQASRAKRHWWPTREERLVGRLVAEGHRATLCHAG